MTADQLTPREREILALMAEGLTNRQIAGRLTVEPSTVRWYARQIYAKLGAADRQEAVAQAAELGLGSGPAVVGPPHNLPAPATPFVGRERELARLDALLADPAVRLVTITGPGGMGKTRLALAAAERQLSRQPGTGASSAGRFPDGIWYLPVAGLGHVERLVPALAQALEFPLPAGPEYGDAQSQLLSYLRTKRSLLVIDDFDDLLAGAGLLAEILVAAPAARMLVTSRERLQLHGEHLLPLEGLETPADDALDVANLKRCPAAQLFLNAAGRVQPDFELTAEQAPHLGNICRSVAGMPLGLELAAAWAGALPLAEIAAEINRSLNFLEAELRDLPPRHASIQAALDSSWQRLTAEQQRAFQRLCHFQGGFTRPAALAVAGTPLPLLVQLANKSWLVYDQKADRYRVHPLLRQYGQQRLAAEPAEEEETRLAHAAYFCAFLADQTDEFYGPRQLEVIQEIQADLDNVWLAFDSALGRGAVELFTYAQASLARFCNWVAPKDEGRAAMERAAAVLGELIAASPSPPADWLRLRADALCRQANLTVASEAAGLLLRQAGDLLDQAESLGADARAERAHWHVRTSALKIDNDLSGAAEDARRSLALYRSLDDWIGICIALDHLAYAEWWLGQFGAAADHLQEILALSGAHGDRAFAIWATGQLAIVHKVQARFDEAEAFDRQAIALSVALGRRWDEAGLTSNYADTLTAHGKFEDGLAMARRGLGLYEALGRVDSWAQANVGYPLLHLGRYADARAALLKALDSTSRALDLWIRGVVLLNLAQVAAVERGFAEAEANLEHSQALLAQSGRSDIDRPPIILAYLRRLQGGPAEATLAEAIRLVLERRFARPPMALWPIAALLAADRGDLERAAELHALSQTFPYIANSRWFHDVAGRELDEIVARLPAEVATAAIERGRKLDLWATVEALAAELSQD